MNNNVVVYEPENYNPILMEEYLFESAIRDDYFGQDSTNLYFDVRPRERDLGIPHIHVSNVINPDKHERRSKKFFECCIRLKHCAYWNHEPWMRKIPNQKLKDKIVRFLSVKSAESEGLTMWEYFKNRWLSAYPNDKELRNIKTMPDYSKLSTGLGR